MSIIAIPLTADKIIARSIIANPVRTGSSGSGLLSEYTLLDTISGAGTGGLTPAAIGDTDGNRLSPDFESIWHENLAEEMRFEGLRRVHNLLPLSEDFSQAAWTKGRCTATADTLTADQTNTNGFYVAAPTFTVGGLTITAVDIKQGTLTFASITLSNGSTNGCRAWFDIENGVVGSTSTFGSGYTVVDHAMQDMGDGWYRCYLMTSGSSSAKCFIYPSVPADLDFDCTTGDVGYVRKAQLEDSTGRSDTTTPSAYVPTGVGTGPELVTNGDFATDSDWTKGSGWAIADGVATHTIGSGTTIAAVAPPLALGVTYLATYTISNYVGSGAFAIRLGGSGGQGTSRSANGTYSEVIIAAGSGLDVFAINSTVGGDIDNISVKQIDSGANVSGVQNFPTLNGNTVVDNVVTEAVGAPITVTPPQYVELSGNSGSFVSTADSAAVSVLGSIGFVAYIEPVDWTPSSNGTIRGKYGASGNRSYLFDLTTSGALRILVTPNGSTLVTATSTVSTGFTNGTGHWVKGEWSNAGNVANLYTSNNGPDDIPTDDDWVQLGDADLSLISAGIHDSTQELELGSLAGGTVNRFNGKILRSQVYDGTTLVADFNAADGELKNPQGPFTSSTTGEEYTVNGDAFLDTDVTPRVMTGIRGYLGEGEATEISGRSNDLAGWTHVTTAAATKNAIGLGGAPNTAFSVVDNSASITELRRDSFTITSGTDVYYQMVRVAYDASPSVYPEFGMGIRTGSTLNQRLVFDRSDGTYVELSTDGSVISVELVGGWWYVLQSLPNISGTELLNRFAPAYNLDGSSTVNNAAQGTTIVASCEIYKNVWSYSPVLTTGGTTKTRLADVGATLSLANFSDPQGSMQFVLTPHFDEATGLQQGIITPNASDAAKLICTHGSIAKRLLLRDGTTIASVTPAWGLGDSPLVKLRWNDDLGKMRFSVAGVLSAEVSYDGSFNPSGALTLFLDLTLGASMKDLSIWSTDLTNDWL